MLNLLLLGLFGVSASSSATEKRATAPVSSVTCNGQTYVYQELAGYGYVASDAYDVHHDTIGGIGSSIAIPRSSWKKDGAAYTGTLWAMPDRGWNTEGTLNFQSRAHEFALKLTPKPAASLEHPVGPNILLEYQRTVFFTDPSGNPTTGLDANDLGHIHFNGFPNMPVATFTGNGFGSGDNSRTHNSVPNDLEGLVVMSDGSFWASDEYGPYIYHFSPTGKMIEAIRPPAAIIPMRNGSVSFSADSPTFYSGEDDDVNPTDPDSGRENNHGFEGLTINNEGTTLYVMLQAADVQEGGLSKTTERYVRFLQYDISSKPAVYEAEYVVPLPIYNSSGKLDTAAQSEIHYITDTQFLTLARDSNAGQCQSSSTSLYRHADVFDISGATNIKGSKYDCANCSIASVSGVLDSAITPAEYCPWLDYNVNSQLERFGVHNGGAQDPGLLNEKWESLALVPVNDGTDGMYFLFSMSDNDFITQNGHLNHGKFNYSDASGCNLDSQILAFQVQLPNGAAPNT